MSNMSQSNPIQKEIWWKQPWPWIILGMLGSVVVASMVTIVIAVKTQDTLVDSDYTKAGKTINLRLEKDHKAERLGIAIQLTAKASPDGYSLITANYKAADPAAGRPKFLRLNLSHPTLANRDVAVALIWRDTGEYKAQISDLPSAHWYYSIEDPEAQWRVKGRLEN
jgi:hypothetical protein